MRFEVREAGNAASYSKLALSRGKIPLVLDWDLLSLKQPLQKKGFNVIVPRLGKLDPDMMAEDLPGRIFVTNNPRDLAYSASLLDYSIIDATLVTNDPERLASMIARAWVDCSLKSEHPALLSQVAREWKT
jgi:hypothetical protein